jgi:tetratricopeptide (TPR) repeat protein
LKLFGAPALLRDGAPLAGPAAQRRRLALLALLARAGVGGVSRDRLTALLWPDAPEERARASLAQGLVRALAAVGDREAALRHIQVFGVLTRDELGLELDDRWQQLEQAIRSAPRRTAPTGAAGGGDSGPGTPAHPASPPEGVAPVAPAVTPAPEATAAAPEATASTPTPEATAAAPARPGLLAGAVAAVVMAAIAFIAVGVPPRDRAIPDVPRTDATGLTANRRPVLAVGRIAATEAEASLADLLAAMLASSLARLDRLDVISRERLAEFARARPDSAALVTAARDAGATERLTGVLTRDARGRLQLELVRTATDDGTIRSAVRLSAVDLVGAADSATLRLARELDRAAPLGSLADVTSRSETAWRLYEEATRLIEQGNNATARELYADALREDPDVALAALGLARVSERADWLRIMPRTLALAERATPLVRLLVRAEYALGIEDPTALALADSLALLGQRSAYGRDRLLHHHVRGLILEARGDTAGAIGAFERAVYSPTLGYTRTNLHLARLYLARGRGEEARTILRAALRGLSLGGSSIYANRRELRDLLARAQR